MKKSQYEKLTKNSEQIDMFEWIAERTASEQKPIVYGYARVSTSGQAANGNSLEAQKAELERSGASQVVCDAYTGKTTNRPELQKLLGKLREGDTLMVTKLDRIARSVREGAALIEDLTAKGIRVHVLNMGVMDSTPTGKLQMHMLLAIAEFEREMILERTREGKEIAKKSPLYHEGRPQKYSDAQIQHAVSLLQTHSYSEVVKLTGISKSTILRANKALKRQPSTK